jgi:hypothetical protein
MFYLLMMYFSSSLFLSPLRCVYFFFLLCSNVFPRSGDGGGGPSRMILERLKRSDTDGLPKLKYATAEDYFKTIEKEKNHPTWVCRFIVCLID